MHRLLPVVALVLVAAGVLGGGPSRTAGQTLPTPPGQLGGREPLQLTPSLPTAPPPTATPTPPLTPTPTSTAGPNAGDAMRPAEVAAAAAASVVVVIAVDAPGVLATPLARANVEATGTGFVVDAAGHVLTTAALAAGRDDLLVFLASGERRAARVVGSDPLTGVAVLRVDGEVPPPLPLAADGVRPGDTVVALGSPAGELPLVVEVGEVRSVGGTTGAGVGALVGFDAPAVPGVDGGPVLNANGEVAGLRIGSVPVAADADRPFLPDIDPPELPELPDLPDAPDVPVLPGVDVGQSAPTSFAVPSATLRRVTDALVAEGRVRYPYLGAAVTPVGPRLAAERGLASATGALVEEVEPDMPASDAGVRAGDVILAIDGEPIGPGRDLLSLLLQHRPGDTVALTVARGAGEIRVDVVLGERPER